jgi:hypothetical protein
MNGKRNRKMPAKPKKTRRSAALTEVIDPPPSRRAQEKFAKLNGLLDSLLKAIGVDPVVAELLSAKHSTNGYDFGRAMERALAESLAQPGSDVQTEAIADIVEFWRAPLDEACGCGIAACKRAQRGEK